MISKEEVKKIAGLARIRLSEDEEESFQKDLSSILDYVETLNEVDVLMVEPTLNAVSGSNIVREDEQVGKTSKDDIATIIESAPNHADGLIKVKAVL